MIDYERGSESGGGAFIQIKHGSHFYADFTCTEEEADEFENMIARIANRRNKKAASVRRERSKKVTNRTRELYGRSYGTRPYQDCYDQAVREVDG